MKKSLVLILVLICAVLSVLSVSAAYYDQDGNHCWCNKDSYGCRITAENGKHEYIMFWSEAARDYIMGKGSDAPLADIYGYAELPMRDSTPEPGSSVTMTVTATPTATPTAISPTETTPR